MQMTFCACCRRTQSKLQHKKPPTDRMREIPPARESPLSHNLKAKSFEQRAPFGFISECARSGSRLPQKIMPRAHPAIPPTSGDVFVNDREAAFVQHSTQFVQHDR